MNMDIQKADQHFIHTYNRKITFVKGEGMYLIDDTGRKYLDMGAGIAVSALGYSNDEYKQALNSGNIVVVFPDRAEKYLSTTMFREFED